MSKLERADSKERRTTMTTYNPKSLKAEEFINHAEILDTLAYADAHKNDMALVHEILDKARLRKGLTHR